MAQAPNRIRSVLTLLFKVTVSAGLLWLLLGRVDLSRLWTLARHASLAWLSAAVGFYLIMILVSAWRWHLLLRAQGLQVRGSRLINSYLVATFFNNFLPSNIGGDVVRVRDTAQAAGSKTLATTVILADRGIGLMGLCLVGAVGATSMISGSAAVPLLAPALWLALAVGFVLGVPLILRPRFVARLLGPLRRFHQEWVGERIERLTSGLDRFGRDPRALAWCFVGAVVVQGILVAFYALIARSMHVPVTPWHLAVIVPVSFIVQMAPVSVNGFGIREATFTFYFTRLGLPPESALAVSFMGAGLVMLVSLLGAAAYILRSSSSDWKPTSPAEAAS